MTVFPGLYPSGTRVEQNVQAPFEEFAVLFLWPTLHTEVRCVALSAPILNTPYLKTYHLASCLFFLGLRSGEASGHIFLTADVLDVRVLCANSGPHS